MRRKFIRSEKLKSNQLLQKGVEGYTILFGFCCDAQRFTSQLYKPSFYHPTMDNLNNNKAIVIRFNKEVIEQGIVATFNEITHSDFVNRSAPPTANGADGMWHTFNTILRPGFLI